MTRKALQSTKHLPGGLKGALMLTGQTILIVETEYLISLSMQPVLQSLGGESFVIMTSPTEALARAKDWNDVGLAIVEIEARKADQIRLARTLLEAGIPVLGLTADIGLRGGLPELPNLPTLIKPVPDEDLVNAVAALTSTSTA